MIFTINNLRKYRLFFLDCQKTTHILLKKASIFGNKAENVLSLQQIDEQKAHDLFFFGRIKHDYRMKKLFFTLLVLMTLFPAAKADPFSFGVTAGMNITKGETSKKWTTDSENGWFAGLQLKATIPVVGLGFDISALYSQESISIPVTTLGSSTISTETDKLKYVTVPLHLRYDLSIPGINLAVVPFVFTGPQAGLTISKIDKSYQDKITTKDLVWRYDLGFGLILLKHLQASYSYSFPLSDTYEGKDFSDKKDQFDEDYKQGVHRISLTYFF